MQVNSINNLNGIDQSQNRSKNHTTSFCGNKEYEIAKDCFSHLAKDELGRKILLKNSNEELPAIFKQITRVIKRANKGKVETFSLDNSTVAKAFEENRFFNKKGDRNILGGLFSYVSKGGKSRTLIYDDTETSKKISLKVIPKRNSVKITEESYN